MEVEAPARSDEVVRLAIAGWCSVGRMEFLVGSQVQTAASVEVDRVGRMRTQTTTFCLVSKVEDDATSADLDCDVTGVPGAGVPSSSATIARGASASAAAVFESVCSAALLALVKGELLAEDPTWAFLAMLTTFALLRSVLVCTIVERRVADLFGEGDDWALMVVAALEVRGEVKSVALRGEIAACEGRDCCLRGVMVVVEARGTLVVALVSSGVGKGSEVRLADSEGRKERDVAGESAEIEEVEAEAEEWAWRRDKMLLLELVLEGIESAVAELAMEEAEVLVGRLG